MNRRTLAVVVALIGTVAGVLSSVGQFLPVIFDRPPSSLGTLAAAMTVLSFLVSPVALFLAGYWHGTDTDVTTEYLAIALTVALAGGGGALVGFLLVVFLVVPGGSFLALGFLISAVSTTIFRAVDFAITGIAGAAVGHFRAE